MKKYLKSIVLISLVLGGTIFFATQAYLTDSYRLTKNTSLPAVVDVGATNCDKATNSSNFDIFIPQKTPAEYSSFLTNHPNYVTLSTDQVGVCDTNAANSCYVGVAEPLHPPIDHGTYWSYAWTCDTTCGSKVCAYTGAGPAINGQCDLDFEYSCVQGSLNNESCTSTTAHWECVSMNGGDTAYCSLPSAPSCAPACFIAGTPITLADGTQKSVEDVVVGDTLVGMANNMNTVQHLYKKFYTRRLYAINGSDYFVTDNHPFMTTEGWKSFAPEISLQDYPDLPISLLRVGDVMVTEQGLVTIVTIDSKESSGYVYTFETDGNHTYYAKGFLVHNGSQGI